jgi:two-component system CheB/CheR fusion protein
MPSALNRSAVAELHEAILAPAPRRVLVIEDNLDAAQSLVLLLRDTGQEVEFAINGYAALAAARRFRPQIVFLDIGLPDTDGFRLAPVLKREPGLERVRILALTAYSGDEYRSRATEAGCDGYLVKPLDPRFLYSLLGITRPV